MADLIDINNGDTGLQARDKINAGFTQVNGLVDLVKIPDLKTQTPPSDIGDAVVVAAYASSTLDNLFMIHACKTGEKVIEQLYGKGSVAASDSTNVGGEACHRILTSKTVAASIGNLTPLLVSGSVVNDNSTGNTSWDESIGRPEYGYNVSSPRRFDNGGNGFGDRPLYKIGNLGSVAYAIKGDFVVNMYLSSGQTGSSNVTIETDRGSAGTYNKTETFNIDGNVGAFKIRSSGISQVKITNNTSDQCWVQGVNITPLSESNSRNHYDAFVYWRAEDENSDNIYWIGTSQGANDIAVTDDGGKFFCSFHGGHSSETVNLYVDDKTVASDGVTQNSFDYGRTISITSESTVTSGSPYDYNYIGKTLFFHGGHRIYNKLTALEPQNITTAFTGMTVTNSRFNGLSAPIVKDLSGLSDGERESLGFISSAIQTDFNSNESIRTTTTLFSDDYSQEEGAYILKRTDDNKFYYNPMYNKGGKTDEISSETEHLFYS